MPAFVPHSTKMLLQWGGILSLGYVVKRRRSLPARRNGYLPGNSIEELTIAITTLETHSLERKMADSQSGSSSVEHHERKGTGPGGIQPESSRESIAKNVSHYYSPQTLRHYLLPQLFTSTSYACRLKSSTHDDLLVTVFYLRNSDWHSSAPATLWCCS